MIIYSLILVISIFTALYCGFYFGYLKREGKPPESMPIIPDLARFIDDITEKLQDSRKIHKDDEDKSFFN